MLSGDNSANTFKGRIGTVDGIEANTLNSGDSIDGRGGNDTLQAQVFAGTAMGGTAIRPIQPEIMNVEVIKLEAQYRDIDTGSYSGPDVVINTGSDDTFPWGEDTTVNVFADKFGTTDDTFIRASEMTDVDQLWSYNSTGDLIIQDLTTLESNGNVRNTKDMTIGMAYTGNSDHMWDESDYKVYFDQDYLIPRSQNDGSQLYIELMDMDAALTGGNPLESNPFGQIVFTMDGVEKTLTFGNGITGGVKTYAQLLTSIQNALTAAAATDPKFGQLTATLDGKFTATDTDALPGGSTQGDRIVITNSGSEVLAAVTMRATGDAPAGKDFHTGFSALPPGTEDIPVEINIALEKVGDSGDGGDLVIGSMNKDSSDSNSLDAVPFYNETTAGFEKFNVTVYGNAMKPSSLGTLRSTNNTLETVIVKSETRTDNSYAALVIGNRHQETGEFGIKDVRTFDATGLKGDLKLVAGLTTEAADKYIGANERNFDYLSGSGDDSIELYADDEFWNNEIGGFDLDIETNEGDDSVSLIIDGDALDFAQSSVTIATGAGNDSVNVTNGMSANQTLNQAILQNFTIDTGAGNDKVQLSASTTGDFIINTGAGDDFIRTSESASKSVWIFNVDPVRYSVDPTVALDELPGEPLSLSFIGGAKLTVSLSGAGIGDGAGTPAAGGGVMAGDLNDGAADAVTDSFANNTTGFLNGYESTVTIDVAGPNQYFGTQADINAAIIAAITGDAVLNKLLKAYVSSNNTLVIESRVEGAFTATDLDINIQQATAGNIASNVLTEARAVFQNSALTMTDLWGSSSPATTAAFTNVVGSNPNTDGYYDGIDAQNLRLGSAGNSETDNVINGGEGNDLIVLSTNATTEFAAPFTESATPAALLNGASNETLVMQGTFGDDTVMNFTDSADATIEAGVDFLDFRSYLNNTYDSSTNSVDAPDSDVSNLPEPIKLAADNALQANEVVVVTLQDFETLVGSDQDFGTLESSFLAALRATAGYTVQAKETDLVESTQKVVFLVENFDATGTNDTALTENRGHYKVFEVTMADGSTDKTDGATGFLSATYRGSLDFGTSLALGNVNLVGSAAYAALMENGFDAANGINGGTNTGILGTIGNDLLVGTGTFTGNGGTDTMTGGVGADTFNVNNAGTAIITNLGTGDNLVVGAGATATASVTSDFTAGASTSNAGTASLTLANGIDANLDAATGTVGYSISASGNALASIIVGSDFADTITGGAGDDTITGGAGVDDMTGGLGNDTFIFATADLDTTAGAVTDIIRDFGIGTNLIDGSFGAGNALGALVEAGAAVADLATLLTAADTALNGTVKYYVGQVTGGDVYLVTDDDGTGYTEVIQLVGQTLASFDGTVSIV